MKSANGTPITVRPLAPQRDRENHQIQQGRDSRRPYGLHLDLEEPPHLLDIEGLQPSPIDPAQGCDRPAGSQSRVRIDWRGAGSASPNRLSAAAMRCNRHRAAICLETYSHVLDRRADRAPQDDVDQRLDRQPDRRRSRRGQPQCRDRQGASPRASNRAPRRSRRARKRTRSRRPQRPSPPRPRPAPRPRPRPRPKPAAAAAAADVAPGDAPTGTGPKFGPAVQPASR